MILFKQSVYSWTEPKKIEERCCCVVSTADDKVVVV